MYILQLYSTHTRIFPCYRSSKIPTLLVYRCRTEKRKEKKIRLLVAHDYQSCLMKRVAGRCCWNISIEPGSVTDVDVGVGAAESESLEELVSE